MISAWTGFMATSFVGFGSLSVRRHSLGSNTSEGWGHWRKSPIQFVDPTVPGLNRSSYSCALQPPKFPGWFRQLNFRNRYWPSASMLDIPATCCGHIGAMRVMHLPGPLSSTYANGPLIVITSVGIGDSSVWDS